MSWVAVAIVGGAIIGGAVQANAAKKAASGQTAATDAAIAEERRQYDLARSDLAPYREAGGAAITRMRDLLGIAAPAAPARTLENITSELRSSGRYNVPGQQIEHGTPIYGGQENMHIIGYSFSDGSQGPDEVKVLGTNTVDESGLSAEAQRMFGAQPPAEGAPGAAATGGMSPEEVMKLDPGYQFRLGEGQKALTNQLGAMGLRNSGAALKAGTRYGQDYATNAYDTIYNRLAGLAGTGQTATSTGASLGAGSAGNIGNLLTSGANARGAARIGAANAYSGALNTVGNYYAQDAYLNSILGARSGAGGMSSTPYYGSYGGGNV